MIKRKHQLLSSIFLFKTGSERLEETIETQIKKSSNLQSLKL